MLVHGETMSLCVWSIVILRTSCIYEERNVFEGIADASCGLGQNGNVKIMEGKRLC